MQIHNGPSSGCSGTTPTGVHRRDRLEQSTWYLKQEYPFVSHFHQTASGAALHYIDEGRGKHLVVLVHGTPGWTFEFRHLIRALVAGGYRVIAPDHIGFGFSDRPENWSYRPADHADNLKSLLRKLQTEANDDSLDWSFVLHDFGGMIGLSALTDLLAHDPECVRSLTVLNSWCRSFLESDPDFQKRLPFLRSGLLRWLYRHANFSARVMVKAGWGPGGPDRRIHKHFLALHRSARDRLGTLGFLRATYDSESAAFLKQTVAAASRALKNVPTQLIWGAADSVVGTRHMEHWSAAFSIAERRELPDTGHFPHEESPEIVNQFVSDFISKHAPRSDH